MSESKADKAGLPFPTGTFERTDGGQVVMPDLRVESGKPVVAHFPRSPLNQSGGYSTTANSAEVVIWTSSASSALR